MSCAELCAIDGTCNELCGVSGLNCSDFVDSDCDTGIFGFGFLGTLAGAFVLIAAGIFICVCLCACICSKVCERKKTPTPKNISNQTLKMAIPVVVERPVVLPGMPIVKQTSQVPYYKAAPGARTADTSGYTTGTSLDRPGPILSTTHVDEDMDFQRIEFGANDEFGATIGDFQHEKMKSKDPSVQF